MILVHRNGSIKIAWRKVIPVAVAKMAITVSRADK
jgi:hypothetical protein